MSDCSVLVQKVIEGDWKEIGELTRKVIDSGTKPEEIIHQLQSGMEVVGAKYSSGEYFLPDMMKSARCMNIAFEVLKPLVEDSSVGSLGKIVIGTVKADMHDIGKNIVAGFLKGVGNRLQPVRKCFFTQHPVALVNIPSVVKHECIQFD